MENRIPSKEELVERARLILTPSATTGECMGPEELLLLPPLQSGGCSLLQVSSSAWRAAVYAPHARQTHADLCPAGSDTTITLAHDSPHRCLFTPAHAEVSGRRVNIQAAAMHFEVVEQPATNELTQQVRRPYTSVRCCCGTHR